MTISVILGTGALYSTPRGALQCGCHCFLKHSLFILDFFKLNMSLLLGFFPHSKVGRFPEMKLRVVPPPPSSSSHPDVDYFRNIYRFYVACRKKGRRVSWTPRERERHRVTVPFFHFLSSPSSCPSSCLSLSLSLPSRVAAAVLSCRPGEGGPFLERLNYPLDVIKLWRRALPLCEEPSIFHESRCRHDLHRDARRQNPSRLMHARAETSRMENIQPSSPTALCLSPPPPPSSTCFAPGEKKKKKNN